ncbi:MAG TPA: hypothetical protein VH325_14315 [Bryobacteraceae bacterium]|jgi:hypothetical protein|nr:hypothetical protein [Bryobacteraceae bacterium]
MSEGGNNDRLSLSDTELLDALEMLLRHPEFYDLSVGYDSEESRFYAGWEVGTDLRDVLRTVLLHNRPAGLPLKRLLPSLLAQGENTETTGKLSPDMPRENAGSKSATSAPHVLVHRTGS